MWIFDQGFRIQNEARFDVLDDSGGKYCEQANTSTPHQDTGEVAEVLLERFNDLCVDIGCSKVVRAGFSLVKVGCEEHWVAGRPIHLGEQDEGTVSHDCTTKVITVTPQRIIRDRERRRHCGWDPGLLRTN